MANPFRGEIRDLTVASSGSATTIQRILLDGMLATLANEFTLVVSEVPEQVAPLHNVTSRGTTTTRDAAVSKR